MNASGPSVFGKPQRAGHASAARTAREYSFQLRQAARRHEAFLVIHLDDVVQNVHVHGGGKKIFADAFHHVGAGLADFSGL